jgi:hypothetical protein
VSHAAQSLPTPLSQVILVLFFGGSKAKLYAMVNKNFRNSEEVNWEPASARMHSRLMYSKLDVEMPLADIVLSH